jgi:hypothetical protein
VLYKRNVAFVGLELVERHVECSVVVHVKIVTTQRRMRLKTVKPTQNTAGKLFDSQRVQCDGVNVQNLAHSDGY